MSRRFFDLGEGIEFGQRLAGFSVLVVFFFAILVLHACGVVAEGLAIAGWTGLCGVAGALQVGRSIQKAAREKANGKVEFTSADGREMGFGQLGDDEEDEEATRYPAYSDSSEKRRG